MKSKRKKNPFRVKEIIAQKIYCIMKEVIRDAIDSYIKESNEKMSDYVARRLMCALTNKKFIPKKFIASKELVRCSYPNKQHCPRTCTHRYWHTKTLLCDEICGMIQNRATIKHKCLSSI